MAEEATRLKVWEEIIGIPRQVKEEEECIVLCLDHGNKISLPVSYQLKNKLKNMIGKKIAILHTDLENKPYLLRNAEAEK